MMRLDCTSNTGGSVMAPARTGNLFMDWWNDQWIELQVEMTRGGLSMKPLVVVLSPRSKNLKTMESKRKKRHLAVQVNPPIPANQVAYFQNLSDILQTDLRYFVQLDSKKPKFSHSSGSQDIRGFLKSPSTSGLKSTAPSSVPAVTSTKGKSLIGSGGILSKNKGSSTVTVKSPSLGSPGPSGSVDAKPTQGGVVSKPASNFVAFTGRGHTLGGGVIPRVEKPPQASTISKPKAVEIVSLDDSRETAPQENMAPCPVCGMSVAVSHINQHLDLCLKLW